MRLPKGSVEHGSYVEDHVLRPVARAKLVYKLSYNCQDHVDVYVRYVMLYRLYFYQGSGIIILVVLKTPQKGCCPRILPRRSEDH